MKVVYLGNKMDSKQIKLCVKNEDGISWAVVPELENKSFKINIFDKSTEQTQEVFMPEGLCFEADLVYRDTWNIAVGKFQACGYNLSFMVDDFSQEKFDAI